MYKSFKEGTGNLIKELAKFFKLFLRCIFINYQKRLKEGG